MLSDIKSMKHDLTRPSRSDVKILKSRCVCGWVCTVMCSPKASWKFISTSHFYWVWSPGSSSSPPIRPVGYANTSSSVSQRSSARATPNKSMYARLYKSWKNFEEGHPYMNELMIAEKEQFTCYLFNDEWNYMKILKFNFLNF